MTRKTIISFFSLTAGLILTHAICFAQSEAGLSGELGKIYLAYVDALGNVKETKDIRLLVEQIKPFATLEKQRQLEKLNNVEDKETLSFVMAFLKGVVLFPGLEVVNEIIEGDRGVLTIQGFEEGESIKFTGPFQPPEGYKTAERKPIKVRQYGIVFFKKEDGKWIIDYTKIRSYSDPRPFYERIDGKDWKFQDLPFHCNFAQSQDACASKDWNVNPLPDTCWECFAKLGLDASLCDNIATDLEQNNKEFFQDTITMRRSKCKNAVTALTGNPKLCEGQPDRDIRGSNPQKQCQKTIERHDFLPSTNIYLIDSDQDGLTDLQETFFNTSIGNKDTDQDGASDYSEVMAMTNPLGEGRLGDHLR